jgi:3-oxoacyl-[acyl-carrier protein] reductase
MNVAPLKGKTLLITGGSRNLGAEVARKFSNLGVRIAVNHLNDEEMAVKLVKYLEKSGGKCYQYRG